MEIMRLSQPQALSRCRTFPLRYLTLYPANDSAAPGLSVPQSLDA